MAMAKLDVATAQSNAVIVPASAGKLILVTRVLFAGASSGAFRLQSGVDGGAPSDLTALIYTTSRRPVDLLLGHGYGVASLRGESLGFTSTFLAPPEDHGLIVWYELVS